MNLTWLHMANTLLISNGRRSWWGQRPPPSKSENLTLPHIEQWVPHAHQIAASENVRIRSSSIQPFVTVVSVDVYSSNFAVR